jgi:hypothetical protein
MRNVNLKNFREENGGNRPAVARLGMPVQGKTVRNPEFTETGWLYRKSLYIRESIFYPYYIQRTISKGGVFP